MLESVIQGTKDTDNYLDDILIATETEIEHLEQLDAVLQRLSKAGFRLRRDKFTFMATSVYLGYHIDSQGIHSDREKVNAIRDDPALINSQELRSFLGLLNYYNRFVAQLCTMLAPLYQLLKQGVEWNWGRQQQTAFQKAKKALLSHQVLACYDVNLEIVFNNDSVPSKPIGSEN